MKTTKKMLAVLSSILITVSIETSVLPVKAEADLNISISDDYSDIHFNKVKGITDYEIVKLKDKSISCKKQISGDFNQNGILDDDDIKFLLESYICYYVKSNDKYIGEQNYNFYKTTLNWSDDFIKLMDINEDLKIDATDVWYGFSYIRAVHYGYEKEYSFVDSGAIEGFNEDFSPNNSLLKADIFNEVKDNFPGVIKEFQAGDANKDASIDSKDAVVVLKAYTENLAKLKTKLKANSDSSLKFMDINSDGIIDSKDAVEILKVYADEMTFLLNTY